MAKVMISMDDNLLERIENYADKNYMSRSGFLTLAATQYLNSAECMLAIKDLSVCVRKIADSGNIDADALEQLEDFERFSKVLMGQSKAV